MKKFSPLAASVFLAIVLAAPVSADRILYAEQYYRLYHQHFYQYPDDSLENIFYLQRALHSDFANPLYAIARVKDKNEYRRYMDLFRMHVNLKIIEQYLHIAAKFDKFEVYFFNKEGPWKNAILDSLNTAEWAYRTALTFWDEAQRWSREAFTRRGVHLPEIQMWEDENLRIEIRDLDYRRIIEGHLARLARTRAYLASP
ncbi:MAG: hypothetical protein JXD23_03925 [Spirochaetales bacterium]|nr:hypothetical protein [Spirochaetales bacterium]